MHEIEWVNDGELVYPAAFHQLPPQFMRWEDRAGEVDRLLFVQDGEAATPRPFPANKYIVALNTSGPDHPLYNAMYYSLIAWYGAYKFGLGWFMEYCQKYGMPKLVFHYESERDRQQLEKDLAEERVLNNILLKGDRAVDIANAPASGASLPQRELLNLAESQCHKLILGQTLTSDTSQHGGSLAQAKVHAGVHAEVVKKRAAFVADVLNTQLIPAIVLLNYGTLDVPMPELVFKLPQEGVTLERVQVLKTALEIKGMRIKKSEAYEFVGFAQPAEGDDVFESASEGGEMAGLAGLLAKGKGKPQDDTDPDDDPNKPKKKVKPSTAEDAEPVSAANPYGCNQYGEGWKAPHNGRASKPGSPVKKSDEASKGSFKIPRMHVQNYTDRSVKVYLPGEGHGGYPSYVFLPKVWVKNTEDGQVEINIPEGKTVRTRGVLGLDLTGEDLAEYFEEEANKLNEWEVEEALNESLTHHFEKEAEKTEEYIDVEEEVNTRVREWYWERQDAYMRARKEYNDNNKNATLREIERYADSVARKVDKKYLEKYRFDRVHSARTDSPTDPAQEWLAPIKQKFLEARKAGASMAELKQMLLTMHPNTKALAKAFANNILAGFAGEAEEVDAANPYGCNQYGEGWKMPHRGIRSKTKTQEKAESERLAKVRPDAENLLEEYKKVRALWSGDDLGKKASKVNKLHLIREIWSFMASSANAIKRYLNSKGLSESNEKYFQDEMSELEKQMKRAQKWARIINSKTQGEELRAVFAELEQELQEEYIAAARTDDASRRRSEPIEMPDGTKCYTEDCNRHDKEGERNQALPNLPTSMELVSIVPELENYGVPGGRVYIRRKLKGKFPIKGRMKNKKKAIGRFKKVLTPPYSVSEPYQEIDAKGKPHTRIDIIKTENGVTRQLVIQTSGDYAGGIVTYIDDISKPRMQKRTAGARTIR